MCRNDLSVSLEEMLALYNVPRRMNDAVHVLAFKEREKNVGFNQHICHSMCSLESGDSKHL